MGIFVDVMRNTCVTYGEFNYLILYILDLSGGRKFAMIWLVVWNDFIQDIGIFQFCGV